MPQNLIEKIAQNFVVGLESGQLVYSGDYITIQPAHILTLGVHLIKIISQAQASPSGIKWSASLFYGLPELY